MYRLLVNFARGACSKGYYVLQFDYYGYGDSEGDAGEVTVESMLDDIESAYSLMLSQYSITENSLLGLRYGGTLAAQYSADKENIRNVILWSPIIDVKNYVLDGLRKTLAVQTAAFKKIILTRDKIIENIVKGESSVIEGYDLASIDGYPVKAELYNDLISQNLNNMSIRGKKHFSWLCVEKGAESYK